MRAGVLLELSHRLACSVKNSRIARQTSSCEPRWLTPTGAPRALQLAEQLGELGLARAEGGDAAGLDVAGVVHAAAPARRSAAAARLAVLGGVLAVGGVEEVGVVAARVEALLQHLEREARRRWRCTVPPLEEAWKNWLSSNSQASAAWARNSVSTLVYWRRMPCSAKKKNCLARRRCASSMLPETSRAKITAALVGGRGALRPAGGSAGRR